MAYNATFLVRISTVLRARTSPASSMVKPAAIHITNAAQTSR